MDSELDTISYGAGDDRSRSYLGLWYDAGLELPPDLSVETIIVEEVERIAGALAVVLYAASIPRRLGGEASGEELAGDKKRCRRVAHAFQQAHRGWTRKGIVLPNGDEIRMAGAQLLWAEWSQQHFTDLNYRSRRAATFSVRALDAKIARWGKTAITNYNNERRWIEYALRD